MKPAADQPMRRSVVSRTGGTEGAGGDREGGVRRGGRGVHHRPSTTAGVREAVTGKEGYGEGFITGPASRPASERLSETICV